MPLAPFLPSPEGISYGKRSLLAEECSILLPSSLCEAVCVCIALSCLTLSDPMNCSLPGSSVRGILLARILEWVASSFSRGSV